MALATDLQTVFDDPIRKSFSLEFERILLVTTVEPFYCGHLGDLVKFPV